MPKISLPAVALLMIATGVFVGSANRPKVAKANTFIAVLGPGQGSSIIDSSAFGVAFGTYDKASGEFCFTVSYNELSSPETSAHIHGPAEPGETASIIEDLSDPVGSPKSRCFGPLKPKQLKNLRAGLWYVNIHTDDYFQGEIRGQIIPAAAP